jgi:chemotaxis signal transduction protein
LTPAAADVSSDAQPSCHDAAAARRLIKREWWQIPWRPKPERPHPTDAQWVLFLCDGDPFGFPLERVTEIMTPRPVTRLPGAVADVCGLVGVRGTSSRPSTCARCWAAACGSGATDDRLLLVDLGPRRVAVMVDDVLAIEPASAPARGGAGRGVPAAALLGTGTADAGRFVAMDPAALLGGCCSEHSNCRGQSIWQERS